MLIRNQSKKDHDDGPFSGVMEIFGFRRGKQTAPAYGMSAGQKTVGDKGKMKQTDIIIPVYRPTRELFTLLDRLQQQTVPVHKIFLINTEDVGWKNQTVLILS